MRRYIRADLWRIFRRVPRWIILGLIIVVGLVMSLHSADSYYELAQSYVSDLAMFNIAFGMIEIIFIYGDDFKAKIMQMAIGTGLPRQKVIHAKWIVFMIVTAMDIALYVVPGMLIGIITPGVKGGCNWSQLITACIMAWLIINAYLGSIMFIMYWMQGISLTLLIFLLLGCNLVPTAVKALGTQFHLTRFHLQTYTLSSMLESLQARLIMGNFSWFNAIGILLYMIVGFVLASILFKKKELEF